MSADSDLKTKAVSLVIPVLNEAGFIENCIASLLRTDYPKDLIEIIIADGMSTDNTRELASKTASKFQVKIHIIDNPRRDTTAGLNLAIRKATGEYIIRVDAHSEFPPDYIERVVELVEKTGADNAGGVVRAVAREKTPMGLAIAEILSHPFGVGNSGFRLGAQKGWSDTVPFGCYPKRVFDEIGDYDERLIRHQDYEFNQRLLKNGGRIYMDPDIVIEYMSRSRLGQVSRHMMDNGYWNAFMHYLHPASLRLRHTIPTAFAGYVILLTILVFISLMLFSNETWLWVLITFPMMLYVILALLVSLRIAMGKGWNLFHRLGPAFFVFHFSYGLGNLAGWFKLLSSSRLRSDLKSQAKTAFHGSKEKA